MATWNGPAATLALLADADFWMPVRASSEAGEVDWLFWFIFYTSGFFFVLIIGLMLLFILRYRRRRVDEAGTGPHHNTALEVVWTAVPVMLVSAMFYFGMRSFVGQVVTPGNAYEIQVTGQKWKWSFTYPNGYVDENLHVPADVPVRLVMTSSDVIHSLFVPAFRLKRDVVPGRYTKMWFRAIEPGEYDIYCAEYCGTSHSDMLSKCVVHPPGGFEKWLEEAANFVTRMPPVEAGERLYKVRGCSQCHSVGGQPGIGPTFKGLFGHTQVLAGGGNVTVDENYIRQSILEPQAQVAAGFDPVMPTYQGRLKDPEIAALIEYIKSLR
ncbi:MAG: cytochrome c oxidase subunit II [Acidobacteria bacterium]|nr:cytochrome c oxidase subunit II [Acidobacteriota bacterium]